MHQETILVIDDSRQISNDLARDLLPSLGYNALLAYDGNSALEHLRSLPVSLIIIDLQSPDASGLDYLRQLVGEGYTIPTILVTAHGSEQIAVDSFRLGVQDYLNKPIDADRLDDALTRALTESRLKHEKTTLMAQLREQLSLQAVLSKIGQSITSSLDIDEVLRRIVEAGVKLTQAEEGFLALIDEQTERLFLRAAMNIDGEKSKTMRLPLSDTLISQVLETLKPVRTTTRSSQDALIKISTGFLVHSVMHVPIISRENPLGVLTMVNHSSHKPFKEKDEALIHALAGYAAIALDNAGLYQQSQTELVVRKQIEEALRESEERYALAMDGSNDGLWDWDLRTNQIYFSPRWKSMIGFGVEDFDQSPQSWFTRVHPDDVGKLRSDLQSHLDRKTEHFENEHRLLHKNGSYRWILSRGQAVWDLDDRAHRIAGSITDITDRKYAEQKLLHYAFYDKLTGLPNRALFLDHLGLTIERAKRRNNYEFAVLFMDLDQFKDVNDSLGHLMGDELLIAVGQLIQKRMRSTDTVARFGGDEFVILLDDIRQQENALQIADWIHTALSMPFYIYQHEVYITASIGIVLNDTQYDRPEDILRDADIAMYSAKTRGKARYEVFNPKMRTLVIERLELATDLRRAIENQELEVHYQVMVSLETGKLLGVEALVRWQHPQRGMLEPNDFIPLAEETGLIISIDRWVMREACRQLHAWQKEFPVFKDIFINVNISGKHLGQSDFISTIQDTLAETGVSPENLTLDITESVIVENRDTAIDLCTQLKGMGVHVQIDDFGIGYSSLSYISGFPINALKIDRRFISAMNEDNSETSIVQAIIMLAKRLGVSVIAEGIETPGQFNQLKNVGCEYGQGYYISKPLNSSDAKQFLLKSIPDGNSK